jgi:hypothetical protein
MLERIIVKRRLQFLTAFLCLLVLSVLCSARGWRDNPVFAEQQVLIDYANEGYPPGGTQQ